MIIYSEIFEAHQWHSDPRLSAPMIVLTSGQHLFLGDFVTLKDNPRVCAKVVKFALKVRQHKLLYNCVTNIYSRHFSEIYKESTGHY